MKKFLTIMLLSVAMAAEAQTDTLCHSAFTAVYLYECKTVDADGQSVVDSLLLAVQAADGITKCFPYNDYKRQKHERDDIIDTYKAAQMHVGTIFMNYPAGRVTVQEELYPYRYQTDEAWRAPEWTLTEGEDSVMGYLCQKASTTYNGLTWHACYTEEVASSIGPWKLGGLPGLITRASDDKGVHTFTLYGLLREEQPVLLTEYVTWIVPEGPRYVRQRVDFQKKSAADFLAYKKKVLGSSRYLKDPTYYAPDAMNAFGYVEKHYSGASGSSVNSVAGVVILNKAHQYQPLEKE